DPVAVVDVPRDAFAHEVIREHRPVAVAPAVASVGDEEHVRARRRRRSPDARAGLRQADRLDKPLRAVDVIHRYEAVVENVLELLYASNEGRDDGRAWRQGGPRASLAVASDHRHAQRRANVAGPHAIGPRGRACNRTAARAAGVTSPPRVPERSRMAGPSPARHRQTLPGRGRTG